MLRNYANKSRFGYVNKHGRKNKQLWFFLKVFLEEKLPNLLKYSLKTCSFWQKNHKRHIFFTFCTNECPTIWDGVLKTDKTFGLPGSSSQKTEMIYSESRELDIITNSFYHSYSVCFFLQNPIKYQHPIPNHDIKISCLTFLHFQRNFEVHVHKAVFLTFPVQNNIVLCGHAVLNLPKSAYFLRGRV